MTIQHNFLPDQYDRTNPLPINHNYLLQQFADVAEILGDIEALVKRGDFTLGRTVDEFEQAICRCTGSRYCIGVGSGTDALFLSLKAAGVGPGHEVITTPYTFFATVSAIVAAGARPVFADIREDYNIDPGKITAAITPNTRAILPVHWSGCPCEMDAITAIANKHGLKIVEDACHGIQATYRGTHTGRFGIAGCFSLHPLKNLNVWGDGGYIITDSQELHDTLVLLRNHGLINRDECGIYGHNSRLDALQAIVANHLLKKLDGITAARIAHAARFDRLLAGISGITIPPRPAHVKQVYHLYIIRAQRRDALQQYLIQQGVDAKVHYPIPMHLQPAAKSLGYTRGDFPVSEAVCASVLSLPVHEFITDAQIDYTAEKIRDFYAAH